MSDRPHEPGPKAEPGIDFEIKTANAGDEVSALLRIEVRGTDGEGAVDRIKRIAETLKAQLSEAAPFRLRSWHNGPDGQRFVYCFYERCNGRWPMSRAPLRPLVGDAEGMPTGLPHGWVMVSEYGLYPKPFCCWHHASLYAGRQSRKAIGSARPGESVTTP